jgi:hypothetical protein
MQGLVERMDAFSLMEKTELKDRSGKVIGLVVARPDGTQILRDRANAFMGSFDRRTNETRDRRGKLIGKGNLLALLIREALGTDASLEPGGDDSLDDPPRNPNPHARSNQDMEEGWLTSFRETLNPETEPV